MLTSAANRWDLTLFDRLHRRDPGGWDTALARLSTAADHSKLWLGVAAGLTVTGTQNRRAAARGLVGLAAASALANGPAKAFVHRPRPRYDRLAAGWLPRRLPITSSFPSGHSASASAFVTGVALENPKLAAPLGVLAAGVAYSRVNTGVHYPSDVLVGLALGVTAAVVVRAAWPKAKANTAPVAEPVDVPALGAGAGLRVILNTDAADELEATVRRTFPAADLHTLREGDDLPDVLAKAAAGAVAIGAAGGDGTINAAAAAALTADLPLLVIPGGTLNHFARALRVETVEDALRAAQAGRGRLVDVAAVDPINGERAVFVNNSSIGVYPELVALRERLEDRLGKWPAATVALAVVLARSTPTTVSIDGQRRSIWLLFAGNCCYTERGPGPISRLRLDDGNLDVRLLDAERRWSRIRLVGAVLARRLDHNGALEKQATARLRVLATDESICVARDGEADDPVVGFDWLKVGSLRVYAP
ncbi:MAG TPA: phosphatase PAP2 family protein [Sporichthyaceae bacterium]